MSASRYVHLDVQKILKETEAAFLVRLECWDELWLPKSQVANPEDYQEGDEDCCISITLWLAREKGID